MQLLHWEGEDKIKWRRSHLTISSFLHGHIHRIRGFPCSQEGRNSLNTFNMNISVYNPETEHQMNLKKVKSGSKLSVSDILLDSSNFKISLQNPSG